MESSAFPINLQCMLIFCQMAHTQKKPNVVLLQFSWVTKVAKGVWVYALSFRRKIWTKGGWYFLLVALYYCKIWEDFPLN